MSNEALAVEFDERKIDAIFADLNQCQRPGAAVGIAIDAKPVYRRGFGLASMELPVILSPATRMRLISITKQFTSLAYMLLCEDGKAGLDDSVGKYLPELNPVTHAVTLRQLMGNIGGLRDAHDISWQFSGSGRAVSSAELLSLYRDFHDVSAAPGITWIYSNGGFLILSAVIERITGLSLEEVLRRRIFEPLSMYDTLLRRWDTSFLANSATSHTMNAAGEYEKSNFFGTAWAGEGGVISTVDDMLRWLGSMSAPTIGSPATWKIMTTPQTLANGTSTGYGLGLFVDSYRGVETIYHPGGGLGSNAWMLKVPAAGLDIVVLVNRQDASSGALAYAILDACMPGLAPVKDCSNDTAVTGVFHSPTTGRVIQLRPAAPTIFPPVDAGRQIALIDGRYIPIAPDEDGVLWPTGIFSHMKLGLALRGETAQPASIHINDFGTCDDLFPVQAACEASIDLISGDYRCDAAQTEATIHTTGDGPRMSTTGRFGAAGFQLECLAAGIWRAKPPSSLPHGGGILSFEADGAAFRFSTLRTRSLVFRRWA